MKKAAAHVSAVVKYILFIGFSIQIILGIVWMCCNFAQIPEYPAADAVLYTALFGLVGKCAPVMYLLQLAAAFGVNYFFLQSLMPAGRWLAVWRALVLLTFPFAMQCHLAVQPHSFVGTLLLAFLAFLVRALREKRACCVGLAALCLAGLVVMCGVADKSFREDWAQNGRERMLADRFAWSTIMQDYRYWSPELQEITKDSYFEASLAPENMEILLDAICAAVGEEKAREYYLEIASCGWESNRHTVIKQLAWDVLGYGVTPVVVQMQFRGRAYDSFTGRNYEVMREAAPKLTAAYVDYGCLWFVAAAVLSALGLVLLYLRREPANHTKRADVAGVLRKVVLPVVLCSVIGVIWIGLFTMRGAGIMDYKWSVAVNELWLIGALLLMEKMGGR